MQNTLWKPTYLIFFNLLSFVLFFSWHFEWFGSFWFDLDKYVFVSFNNSLKTGEIWQTFWGIANNRSFDIVAVGCILVPFIYFGLIKKNWTYSKLATIFVMIALSIVVTIFVGKTIPIERKSPTLHFEDTTRLTQLVSFSTKDSSSDSFPGDHGIGLMMFAGFAFFYISKSYGVVVSLLAIFFTLPRVVAGAHWFTDEAVGALSLGFMTLGWLFYTPLHTKFYSKVESLISKVIK